MRTDLLLRSYPVRLATAATLAGALLAPLAATSPAAAAARADVTTPVLDRQVLREAIAVRPTDDAAAVVARVEAPDETCATPSSPRVIRTFPRRTCTAISRTAPVTSSTSADRVATRRA